jgi:hypothetical protein
MGVSGSPYTRKMLAYMRYRHVSYEFMLDPLLSEIGRVYAPALIANANALQAGDKHMETTIDEYQNLLAEDQTQVDHILADTGWEEMLP